jgi:hypothetical protein
MEDDDTGDSNQTGHAVPTELAIPPAQDLPPVPTEVVQHSLPASSTFNICLDELNKFVDFAQDPPVWRRTDRHTQFRAKFIQKHTRWTPGIFGDIVMRVK